MSKDPEEPEYRVYRGGGSTHAGRRTPADEVGGGPPDFEFGGTEKPPRRPAQRPAQRREPSGDERPAQRRQPSGDEPPEYSVYRSQPRGIGSRLRGETDSDVGRRAEDNERAGAVRRDALRSRERAAATGARPRRRGLGRWGRGTWSIRRAIKYVISAIVAWVLLSGVLFMVSAETKAGHLPAGLAASLTHTSAPMLLSAQNVLVLGLDNRPVGNKEPGANFSEAVANTDSIMIWRVGGGVSRRLSIPRDTLVNVPGLGDAKINAAWSQSPALTVKVVETLTGIKINHVIVVDLANFPKFIDDIGGVTVTTGRICSSISGGASDGGYTLNLKPGTHHLSGTQALTLARTRDNSCNLAYTDIQREEAQQQILNGIKSQLFSFHAFTHLPWASWDAPGVIQTDMGGLTLLQLFASSEIGGSSTPQTLTETPDDDDGDLGDVLIPNATNVRTKVNQLMNG